MRTVTAPKQPLRSADALGISLGRGFQIEKRLSQFFLVGNVLLFLLMLINASFFPSWGIVIFAYSFLASIAFLAFKRVKSINQKIALRRTTYEQGEPVTFAVVKHRRAFVWYKSGRDYVIDCQCPHTGASVSIKSAFKMLWEACPVDSQIHGFAYQGSHLFGEMLSVKFEFK